MNQNRTYTSETIPFDRLSPVDQVVEIFYRRAVELTKAAYQAVNKAYPLEIRRENPRIDGKYAESIRQAKQHLNFFKNGVAAVVPAFCKVTRHPEPYDASQDVPTTQLVVYLGTSFRGLYDKLVEYAELLVPDEDVPAYLKTLQKVFENEHKHLLLGSPPAGIAHYEITPVLKSEDFAEHYGPQVSVDRKRHLPNSEVYANRPMQYLNQALPPDKK